MPLKIYNSLTRQKEVFQPLQAGRVGMYVCGVTVYDLCHVGHARAAVVFDVVYRYFKNLQGKKELQEVIFVRNFTDVDDKIIQRANQEGKKSQEIAEKYIEEFYKDMGALGLLPPNVEPKATEHIPEMIALIQKLMEKGHAYQSGPDVFFEVNSFPGYGKLSGKSQDDLMAGARVAVDEKKRDPSDFALWKGSKPGEPAWESPWGLGRPGWHIECSAMGQKYLGECFDIHGGGKDLIFPHHENEIAQSQCATGREPVRFWVHNGFVDINKEKMSKSLGNFFTIRDVLKKFNPEVLRFFLVSSHYRSPIDFTEQSLKEARIGLEKFYRALGEIAILFRQGVGSQDSGVRSQNSVFDVGRSMLDVRCSGGRGQGPGARDQGSAGPEDDADERIKVVLSTRERFFQEMDDDFNTAAALGHLFEWLRAVNSLLAEKSGAFLSHAGRIMEDFREMAFVLGLFQEEPDQYFERQTERHLRSMEISRDDIERLIEERSRARKDKDWKKSDTIRDQLLEKGVVLEDQPQGTIWKTH